MGIILLGTASTNVPNGTILRNVGQATAATASSIALTPGRLVGKIVNVDGAFVDIQVGSERPTVPSGINVFTAASNPNVTTQSASVERLATELIPADGGTEYYIGEPVERLTTVQVNGTSVTGTEIIGNDRNFIRLASAATSGTITVLYTPENNKRIRIEPGTLTGFSQGEEVYIPTIPTTTLHTHTVTSAVASYPIQLASPGADIIHIAPTNVAQIFI